jgi:cytoskeletal protein CcmA (bactofilin family)
VNEESEDTILLEGDEGADTPLDDDAAGSEPLRDEASAPVCAVGAGARFEGLLSFWGTARVEGAIAGEVASRGTLEVGPAASVVGRVEVDVLIVEGSVEGEVFARERVEVLPGAHVTATIRTPRLAVAEGAHFEGRLDMVRGARAGASAASAA